MSLNEFKKREKPKNVSSEKYVGIQSLKVNRKDNDVMSCQIEIRSTSKGFDYIFPDFAGKCKNSVMFIRRDTGGQALFQKKAANSLELLELPYIIALYKDIDGDCKTRCFYLLEILNIENKNNEITFFLQKKVSLKVFFKHRYDYKSCLRILELRESVHTETKEIGMVQVFPRNEVIKNYSTKVESVITKVSKGLSNLSATYLTTLPNVDDRDIIYKNLIRKDVSDWNSSDFSIYLKQIPFVDLKNSKLISLYSYLKSMNVLFEIDQIFGTFVNKNAVNFMSDEVSNYQKGIRRKEPYKSGNKNICALFSNKSVLHRFIQHLGFLRKFGRISGKKEYSALFYVVLKKLITPIFYSKHVQENIKERFILSVEENKVFLRMDLWDHIALRNKIYFNFLFGTTVENYIDGIIQEFNEFRKNKKNVELRWLEVLEKFNRLKKFPKGFDLSCIFLPANIAKKYYLKQREVEAEKLKFEEVKKDVDVKRKSESFEKTKTFENFKIARIENIDNKSEEEWNKKFKKLKSKFEKQKQRNLEFMIQQNMSKISKLESELKNLEIPKEFDEFKNPKLMEKKLILKISKDYYKMIEKMLHFKFEELFGSRNLKKEEFSLTFQLVLSKHIPTLLSSFEVSTISLLKYLLDPLCFKFGLNHVYVLICNTAFHYFSNSVVYVEDIQHMSNLMRVYEEFASFGVFREIILSKNEFINFVNKICFKILDWNMNYEYSHGGGFQTRSIYEKNCQEFSMDLLKFLNMPFPLYDKILEYIDDVDELEKNSKTIEERNEKLRFIKFDATAFKDEKIKNFLISSILAQRKLLEAKKNKNENKNIINNIKSSKKKIKTKIDEKVKTGDKLFFFSHSELDLFIKKLVSLADGEFSLFYPSVWKILKAFDRSYWIQSLYLPSKKNRPLMEQNKVVCHFFEGNSFLKK